MYFIDQMLIRVVRKSTYFGISKLLHRLLGDSGPNIHCLQVCQRIIILIITIMKSFTVFLNFFTTLKFYLKISFSERDKVLKGMVNLGFALLNVPKSKGKESFCTQMWSIGNDILTKLVKNCSNVSSTIFQDLVNQISQAKESGQYTGMHYFRKISTLQDNIFFI